MEAREIGERIKEIIGDVANLAPGEIGDDANFIEDLQLDSLSLLEIGVDIDYQFKLGVGDEELKKLRTVREAVELVHQVRAGQAADEAV